MTGHYAMSREAKLRLLQELMNVCFCAPEEVVTSDILEALADEYNAVAKEDFQA